MALDCHNVHASLISAADAVKNCLVTFDKYEHDPRGIFSLDCLELTRITHKKALQCVDTLQTVAEAGQMEVSEHVAGFLGELKDITSRLSGKFPKPVPMKERVNKAIRQRSRICSGRPLREYKTQSRERRAGSLTHNEKPANSDELDLAILKAEKAMAEYRLICIREIGDLVSPMHGGTRCKLDASKDVLYIEYKTALDVVKKVVKIDEEKGGYLRQCLHLTWRDARDYFLEYTSEDEYEDSLDESNFISTTVYEMLHAIPMMEYSMLDT
ncbi:hypothetical protein GGR54DRAFT_638925 [Hypoxylon sp. NC1633]|nr:hypothetical protein GGR54DRAFT_638925 [Hypoxylon sp. NC1633]